MAETSEAPRGSWAVLHLFLHLDAEASRGGIEIALKECQAHGNQVVTAALLGHKADLGVLAIGPDAAALRELQTHLKKAGATASYSYLSLTELSEYAAGLPEAMREARLHPRLPPEEMTAFCFYPMSKRRVAEDNWYRLPFEERVELMRGHGAVGREFRGRVLQLVTGSTGLDDYEWGVSLFGRSFEDLKDCVYQMRFDEASARYAEFGPFYAGTVGEIDAVLDAVGCT
jgi:chlorite dismutase